MSNERPKSLLQLLFDTPIRVTEVGVTAFWRGATEFVRACRGQTDERGRPDDSEKNK